ncbi:MAG: biotin--[acetyl-CoA-carboxylase] ligase [Gammaproteobacteria bacterium]|nr:biotin--[acetyl-CoA-carboxylase] ligase [Gammaproteobacteria bacterium]
MKYLQAEALKTILRAGTGIEVVVHESIDSTNRWCLQQCKSGKVLPFACFAEEQTEGRGRRGKQWIMSAQSNIAMSVVWPFVLSKQSLYLLPITIALAIAKTLESIGLSYVQVKWPNDVYVQGKKIAGILIETQPVRQGRSKEQANDKVAAVIGIGLNYDMSHYDAGNAFLLTDICSEVASQQVELKHEINDVALRLLQNVVDACQTFHKSAEINLESFRRQYDFCMGKDIEVAIDEKNVLYGVAQGVNDDGELQVLIDGELRVFNSADISVKTGGQ